MISSPLLAIQLLFIIGFFSEPLLGLYNRPSFVGSISNRGRSRNNAIVAMVPSTTHQPQPPPSNSNNKDTAPATFSAAKSLTQADYKAKTRSDSNIQSKDVAKLPRPGTTMPSNLKFFIAPDTVTSCTTAASTATDTDTAGTTTNGTSSSSTSTSSTSTSTNRNIWITYLAPEDPSSLTRKLYATQVFDAGTTGSSTTGRATTADGRHVYTHETIQLLNPGTLGQESDYSLEEQLQRERARIMTTGVTSYVLATAIASASASASSMSQSSDHKNIMMVPLGGALWILPVDNLLARTDEDGSTNVVPPPYKLIESNTSNDDKDDNANPSKTSLPKNAPLLDAKLSSDGSTVAFVCDKEVYVMSTETPTAPSLSIPQQVTFGARDVPGRTNGIADYLAQEELERSEGYWLSPRGTRLVYEQVDESHIPLYRITHQGQDVNSIMKTTTTVLSSLSPADMTKKSMVTLEEHSYPFAGAQNPIVRLGVVDTTTTSRSTVQENEDPNPVLWFDLTSVFGDDFYLAKVEWLVNDSSNMDSNNDDATQIVVQLLDRHQQKLALVLIDIVTGAMRTVHVERAMEGGWINLNDGFRVIQQSNDASINSKTITFLWASERDGYRHLYIMESNLERPTDSQELQEAKVIRRLTGPGEFIVDQVLDMDGTYVYYMGTSPNMWLESHLFRIKLNGEGVPECLTQARPGMHSCVLNLNAGLYIDSVSSVTQPPLVAVYELPKNACEATTEEALATTEPILKLYDAGKLDDRVSTLTLKAPSFHTFPSSDGKVTLQAAVYLPDQDIYGKGPWPLVVATYGGPHVQYVQNTWGSMTADLRSQFLRANGLAVLKVDNRGSNRRGLVFESPIYGKMGTVEVDDQVAGVEWAIQQGIANPNQIAVSGWSYGGYMALKCLTDRPDVFHAAVSGAPVTDWTLYDTAYTERYMGLPQENPDGYGASSVLSNVQNIDGSLLLCHGLLDENVLFRHSAVLINELIQQQKAYDLVLFPSERHGPRREQDRAFLEERILAFLQRSFGI